MQRSTWLAVTLLVTLVIAPASAQQVILVDPGLDAIIPVGPSPIGPSFAQPLHGTLTHTNPNLVYEPSETFWEVGVDQVTYTPFGLGASPVFVYLIAKDHPTVRYAHGFEGGIEEPNELELIDDLGSASLDPNSAFEGALGLSLVGPGEVYVELAEGAIGGGNHGSGGQGGVDPPWPPSGLFGGPVASAGVAIMTFGAGNELEIRLRPGTNGYELLARHTEDPGPAAPSHSWIDIGQGPRRIAVHTWAEPINPPFPLPVDAGFDLRVDDVVVARRALVTDAWPDKTMRAGLIDLPVGESGALGIDALEVWEPSFVDGHLLQLTETFESGWPTGLSTSIVGTAWLSANPVLAGTAFFVDGASGPAYLRDDGLTAATTAGARFTVRTTDATLGGQTRVRLLDFGAADGGGSARAALWLERTGGVDRLYLEAIDDLGVPATSTDVAIDPYSETIEVIWRQSMGAGKATGSVRLYVDGMEAARLVALDNDGQTVESAAIGVVETQGTVGGSIVMDDFITWQTPTP